MSTSAYIFERYSVFERLYVVWGLFETFANNTNQPETCFVLCRIPKRIVVQERIPTY